MPLFNEVVTKCKYIKYMHISIRHIFCFLFWCISSDRFPKDDIDLRILGKGKFNVDLFCNYHFYVKVT